MSNIEAEIYSSISCNSLLMSLFQNLWLLPDKLINNVGQVGDDEEGDHSQGEIRRFLRCSVEYHSKF